MKGDFSRFTFDPDKQYVGTLMQQGRVQVDADWNEQQAINRHQRQTMTAEVIGPRGAPNEGGGFAIGLAPGDADLTLSPGSIYVDGVRAENSAVHTLTDQPHLKLAQGALAGFQWPSQGGRYLVYLDVWERHVSALEDPQIRETALGGADTTTRIQTVWQAKLTPQPVGNVSCDQLGPGWVPPGLTTNGTMRAQTSDSGAGGPCVLPPVAGFRGLENQLYRIEIHRSGIRDNASNRPTIKWSRDNGAVVTTVTISGQVLTAHDLGRDEVLGFAPNQWVEILDQRMELTHQHGQLLQIDSIDSATREITIKAATPVPPMDTSGSVILRRWDNTGPSATADGIAMTSGVMSIQNGIEVQFSGGRYRSGDYWLIPARTAINSETGSIEWPLDGFGQPIVKAPDGIVHRYCPLALVDFDVNTGSFALLEEGGDCRARFPALSQIRAEDVSFDSTQCDTHNLLTHADTMQQALDALCAQVRNGCTFLITPETDLETIFQRINATNVVNARICFQAGDYRIAQPLAVGGPALQKGHLILTGFGAGTRLIVEQAETFLRFQNCASVTVRDLSVQARRVGSAGAGEHLNGALTFIDCRQVTVEDCHIQCSSAPIQGATGVTSRFSLPAARRNSSVRVRHCRIEMGHEQVGVLVFDAARTQIEDNQISAASLPPELSLGQLLTHKQYRAAARRALVSRIQYGGQAPTDMTNIETVQYGANVNAYFLTAPSLVGQWQALLNSLGPSPSTQQALRERLVQAADQALLGAVSSAQFPAFTGWRNQLTGRFRVVGAQGVVVAGASNGGETRILDNTITGVLQGVRVGYSRREQRETRPIRTLAAQIRGNRVQLIVTPIATRHPEGLFVGSYSNELIVESNSVTGAFSASHGELNAHVEGIKIYGVLGSLLLIRHNNVASVDTAIRVVPLNGPHTGVHRWLVADNLGSGFQTNVDVPESLDQIGNQPGGVSYRDLIGLLNRPVPGGSGGRGMTP